MADSTQSQSQPQKPNGTEAGTQPTDDPLQAIPVIYLLDLLKILHKDIPDALYVEGIVKNVILWRKNKDIPLDLELYGPFADLKYGACVSIFNTSFQAISFYSQDPEDQKLAEALLKTKLIDWGSKNIDCVLDGVPEKVKPIIDEIVSAKKLEQRFSIRTQMYWMDKERARNLKIVFPPGIHLEKLTSKHVDYLDGFWPHSFEGSKDYLRTLLERNLSLGVFQPGAEFPVAWVVCSHSSCMAMLFTRERHRRLGYARLLCTAMARKLGEMDIDPRAVVLDDNQPSKILFMTLGYKTGGHHYYIGLKAKPL